MMPDLEDKVFPQMICPNGHTWWETFRTNSTCYGLCPKCSYSGKLTGVSKKESEFND